MIVTAIPAGFAAGLFGIGGGLITVPILFYIFGSAGLETTYLMHLAVGTSFGIIIPTSIVSVLTHHQHKAVDFSIVKSYGIFVIIGVILGTILAAIAIVGVIYIGFFKGAKTSDAAVSETINDPSKGIRMAYVRSDSLKP